MAGENVEQEGKFKIKFDSIDKRFTNLELALGEFSEKISKLSSVDPNLISELQKKIEDIEDLINVEQIGVVELKKIMTSIDQKFSESKSLLSKDAQNLIQKVDAVEQKINDFSSMKAEADFLNLQLKMQQMSSELEKVIQKSESEVEKLREKTKILDPEVIIKIVKEVTETRSDLSKEIRELKEKIHSQDSTRSEVDMKFLTSRVNSLKEGVDFLVNRKAENDQKIEQLEKHVSEVENSRVEIMGEEFFSKLELSKKDLIRLNSRIDNLEKELHRSIEKLSLTGSLKVSPGDVYSTLEIEKRVGILEEKLKNLSGTMSTVKPSNLDMQIQELLEKIVDLETKMSVLERTFIEPKKFHPLVLE